MYDITQNSQTAVSAAPFRTVILAVTFCSNFTAENAEVTQAAVSTAPFRTAIVAVTSGTTDFLQQKVRNNSKHTAVSAVPFRTAILAVTSGTIEDCRKRR